MQYTRCYIATPVVDSTARDSQLSENNIDRRLIFQILLHLRAFLFSDPNRFERVDL